ncbi:hypothetical protein ACH5RR_032358 [Cinchona calisaya]|uniref:Uncharacterized protein n=1 Tax=Cinchona calisaya TaxID=153742 RepID=A0ABD2YHW2_9GENT
METQNLENPSSQISTYSGQEFLHEGGMEVVKVTDINLWNELGLDFPESNIFKDVIIDDQARQAQAKYAQLQDENSIDITKPSLVSKEQQIADCK